MVRRNLAAMCKVDSEHICAQSDTKDLSGAMRMGLIEGWDEPYFVFVIEGDLGKMLGSVSLPPFLGTEHVGDWVKRVAAILREHCAN